MKIYQPQAVLDQHLLYGNLLKAKPIKVSNHLSALSAKLHEALSAKDSKSFHQVKNYHPDFLGASDSTIKNKIFKITDAQLTIAKEYGFKDWNDVSKHDKTIDINFETTIDFILTGQLASIKEILTKHPKLATAVSHYGHKATLLHYTASNGVEMFRQQVPDNLHQIIKLLLSLGSNPHATMQVYGGLHTTLDLLTTSAHPYKAKVADMAIKAFD